MKSRNFSVAFIFSSTPGDLIKDPSFKETFDVTFRFSKGTFSSTNLGQNVFVSFDGFRHIDAIAVSQVFARHRLQHFHGQFQNGAQKVPQIFVPGFGGNGSICQISHDEIKLFAFSLKILHGVLKVTEKVSFKIASVKNAEKVGVKWQN